MAFTDLDEHLEEVFGERGVEFTTDFTIVDKRPNKERYNPGVYEAKERRKAARRHEDAVVRHLAALESGRLPSTCLGPTCANLLSLAPVKGGVRTVCSKACMTRLRRWRKKQFMT